MIEVTQDDEGYKTMCYSPSRQRLSDYKHYPTDFTALSAAKWLIGEHFARHLLNGFLRDMYELGKLEFDEWRSLNQSLRNP